MPMSEEERRRCIIHGGCTEGMTREQALAEEIQEIIKEHPEAVKAGDLGGAMHAIAWGLIDRGFIRGPEEKGAAPDKGDGRG